MSLLDTYGVAMPVSADYGPAVGAYLMAKHIHFECRYMGPQHLAFAVHKRNMPRLREVYEQLRKIHTMKRDDT